MTTIKIGKHEIPVLASSAVPDGTICLWKLYSEVTPEGIVIAFKELGRIVNIGPAQGKGEA